MQSYTQKTKRLYSKEDIVRVVDFVKKNQASIRSDAKMCGINVYCPECPPGGTIGHPGGQQKKVFAVRSWKGSSGI